MLGCSLYKYQLSTLEKGLKGNENGCKSSLSLSGQGNADVPSDARIGGVFRGRNWQSMLPDLEKDLKRENVRNKSRSDLHIWVQGVSGEAPHL